jgi:thiosulfate/3-mercaptopyruvate sulfurtransferase
MSDQLVSTTWLADHLNDPDLVILDATWLLPPLKRDARVEFETCHIPGARFFDLDLISEQATALPHMLPQPNAFGAHMAALGVSSDSRVVCYDTLGLFSAARCWWMFKVFGHDAVVVLDGGLKKWLAEEKTTEDGPARATKTARFVVRFRPEMIVSANVLESRSMQVVDARPNGRFSGRDPEPRPGVRSGHIPGSVNVPFASVVYADGTLKSPAELTMLFSQAGIDQSKQIVTSCGSGVTAALLSLCLTETGALNHVLYDGSWAEWGTSKREIETG